jgi:hypothetical protein
MIYKIYRIDFLPPHPVNLVNHVCFHRFRISRGDMNAPLQAFVERSAGLGAFSDSCRQMKNKRDNYAPFGARGATPSEE